jgi:hypothetical protein
MPPWMRQHCHHATRINDLGKPERETQRRMIALLGDELSYRFLGDWIDRDGNSNIEEKLPVGLNEEMAYDNFNCRQDKKDYWAKISPRPGEAKSDNGAVAKVIVNGQAAKRAAANSTRWEIELSDILDAVELEPALNDNSPRTGAFSAGE